MRTATLALLTGFTLGVVAPVQAADLDYGVLRGPDYEPVSPVIDWNGVYVGGHGGYTSAALGFKNVFQPIVAKALIATTAETDLGASSLLTPSSQRVDGTSFGAYAGYNYQFEDTVVGVEADYTRFEKLGSTFDALGRSKLNSAGFYETVDLAGLASTKIQEFGTIRARAGYVMGNFLPFITGGVAIGRAQVTDQVAIRDYGYDQAAYKANTALTSGTPAYVNNFGYQTFDQKNPSNSTVASPEVVKKVTTKVVGGVTLGAGLEFALTQNIILRGEYQYVLFNDFDGHKMNLNTVRGGAAVKF